VSLFEQKVVFTHRDRLTVKLIRRACSVYFAITISCCHSYVSALTNEHMYYTAC